MDRVPPVAALVLALGITGYVSSLANEVPWPAESYSQATNLTGIEGTAPNDFYADMSGAAWNPVSRRLWVCRNGPGGSASKFWAIREDGNGGYEIDYKNGNRGEWTGFGDLEDLALADYNEEVIYLIREGEDLIQEYNVSTYGTAVLNNQWSIQGYVPVYANGAGSEGIGFVPDEYLAVQGFVDQNGNPYTSQNGMGGLMFVAHQNGGRLYAFDLNRTNGTYTFVGAYKTSYSESCALSFERSEGLLYIFHGADYNRTEVVTLGSTLVGGERQLNQVVMYGSPMGGNLEGIAVVSNADCVAGHRKFFLTIDGGGATSLLMFSQFPCCVSDPDDDGDGVNNCNDQCPNTPAGETADSSGCSCSQLDSDGDGVDDCNDACPNTPAGQAVNGAGCACSQLDCDDNDVCNGSETCVAGECVAGTPLNCDDSNVCTDDTCDPVSGCVHVAISCDDGIACTTDTCDPTSGCVHLDDCPIDEMCDHSTGNCVAASTPEPLPIAPGDTWRYFKGINSAPPADWNTVLFNDSGWLSGPGGFGYGADCTVQRGTTLSDMQNGYLSVYTRRLFHVDDPGLISQLTLTVDYDDSFVAYINGQEVTRRNVTGNPPAYNKSATQDHECSTCNGTCNPAEAIDISGSVGLLENNTNVLAIQAHNLSLGSSDFTLTVSLTATFGPDCQLDSDGDGVNDCNDACPNTPAGEAVDSNGCSCSQLDDDGDGVNNCDDLCPGTPAGETANNHGCSCGQLDDDNDGVNDCNDLCPGTLAGEAVDINGCSSTQLDDDGDGTHNGVDMCPGTPLGEMVNNDGCACSQLDDDGDGVGNDDDLCPGTPAGEPVNSNGCACSQLDADRDGVDDCLDLCPATPAGVPVDEQGCPIEMGHGDDPDRDTDGDGQGSLPNKLPPDDSESPAAPLPDSPAADTGGPGPWVTLVDADQAEIAEGALVDSDGDGVEERTDACPDTPVGDAVDGFGCSCVQGGDCPAPAPTAPLVGLCGFGTVQGTVLTLVGLAAARCATGIGRVRRLAPRGPRNTSS